MSFGSLSGLPVEDYFIRRLAEEQALADRASDPRTRAGHERAARIFRELIDGHDRSID
jgi:hypothetical protein